MNLPGAPRGRGAIASGGPTRRAVCAAAALACLGCWPIWVDLRVESPDGRRVAEVRSRPSIDPPAQSLWLRTAPGAPLQRLAVLGEDTHACDRIAWSPDSSRVGFLVNGVRLDLYEGATGRLLSKTPLVEIVAHPTNPWMARDLRLLDGETVRFRECHYRRTECKPVRAAKLADLARQSSRAPAPY